MASSLRNVVIAGVVGVGIVAGSVLAAGRCTPSPPGPAGDPAQSVSGRFVKLVFVVTPADAEVVVEGERKGTAGQVIELPRSASSLEIVIRRDGYLPQTIALAPDRDRYVKGIVLVPGAGAPSSTVP